MALIDIGHLVYSQNLTPGPLIHLDADGVYVEDITIPSAYVDQAFGSIVEDMAWKNGYLFVALSTLATDFGAKYILRFDQNAAFVDAVVSIHDEFWQENSPYVDEFDFLSPWEGIGGVAVADDGTIFVRPHGFGHGSQINEYTSTGAFVTSWPVTSTVDRQNMRVVADGSVRYIDTNGAIHNLARPSGTTSVWFLSPTAGTGPGGDQIPDFDELDDGRWLVATHRLESPGQFTSRVYVVSADGTTVTETHDIQVTPAGNNIGDIGRVAADVEYWVVQQTLSGAVVDFLRRNVAGGALLDTVTITPAHSYQALVVRDDTAAVVAPTHRVLLSQVIG